MKIQCQQCTSEFVVPPKYYGKRIKCPKCKGPIAIPSLPQPPGTPSPPRKAASAGEPKTTPDSDGKIKIACGNCDATLNVPKKLVGKKVACPKCKQPVELKEPIAPEPTTEPSTTASEATADHPPSTDNPTAKPVQQQPSPDQEVAAQPFRPGNESEVETPPVQPTVQNAGPPAFDQPTLDQPVAEHVQQPVEPQVEPATKEPKAFTGDDENEASGDAASDQSIPLLQQTLRPASKTSVDETSDDSLDPTVLKKRTESRKRRRTAANGSDGRLVRTISGTIIGIGTLLLAAALYLHFFGAPGQSVADLKPNASRTGSASSGLTETSANKGTEEFAPSTPVAIAEIKPREALAPTFPVFKGEATEDTSNFNGFGLTLTAKSEYPENNQLKMVPEPIHYRGKLFLSLKDSTSIRIDSEAEHVSYLPPETYSSGLRLPEGIFLVPINVVQYADFITVFDGNHKYDVSHSRLLKRGKFRVVLTSKRPDFPRVIASNSGSLNGETKGVSLVWVDRNAEIHILENLDAVGYDDESSDVKFEVPEDSIGGVVVNQSGQIAGLIADVQNGIGTTTQISKILSDMRRTGGEIFNFDRMPVSEDQAGKLREASACLVQVHSRRSQLATQAAFKSKIETQRGDDQTSRQVFDDRYDINFKDDGQVEHFSLYQGKRCRLPGFLGMPGTTMIIEFPAEPGKSEWRIQKKLSLGPIGDNRILISDAKDTNQLNHVVQTDDYRIIDETETHLVIERKYLAKSLLNDPDIRSPQWDIPVGFPFHVEGKFTYRYDKSLKLATSVEFAGIERKQLTRDLVVPLNLSLSLKMTAIPNEEINEDDLPWKSQ